MTLLVRQRGSDDCGIAAVAMFTDFTYEHVRRAAIASDGFRPGKGTNSVGSILRELGFRWDNLITTEEKPDTRPYRTLHFNNYYISAEFCRDQLWGRPCMMSVPSLNTRGGWHLIFYDGDRVYDPQNGRRGKRYYNDFKALFPRSATVWAH